MKLLVCVKQVPESTAAVRLDDATGRLTTDESAGFRMNRFDECAVEEALRLKEAHGDTTVEVATVGPPEWSKVIKRAMGMGADHGIHVVTDHGEPHCPRVRAGLIAAFARKRGYDLVLAGAMAEDDMHAQVGSLLAEFLSIPCATWVVATDLDVSRGRVTAEREIGGGTRDVVELELPASLTVQLGINRPRYPSLSNLTRAHRQPLETIAASDLEQPEPGQEQVRAEYPRRARSGEVLEGTIKEKAVRLVEILRGRAILP
jgi:electron transfer flavoprotein beta subunit